MLQGFLFLFMFFQEISLERLLGNAMIIAGFPIATWVLYGFYATVIAVSLNYLACQRDKKIYALGILFFFFCVVVVTIFSLFEDTSLFTMLSNSVHYIIPVLIYAYVYKMKDRMQFYRSLTILVVISGCISLLFVSGALKNVGFLNMSLIEALTRSSLLVDGGLGLIGFCVGLYGIVYRNDKISFREAIILMLFGLLIVVGGQSRARILTVFICVLFFFLETQMGKQKRGRTWLKLFAWAIFACLLVMLMIPDQVLITLNQVFGRFSTMGTDNSSIYREFEYAQQMELFRSSPIVGVGWNGMQGITVVDTYGIAKDINNHNMYSTILAYGGIVLAAAYIQWFGCLGLSELSEFKRSNDVKLHYMILLVIVIMSISSAGFNKTSMIIGVITIYVDIIERNEKRKNVEVRHETSWNSDLP